MLHVILCRPGAFATLKRPRQKSWRTYIKARQNRFAYRAKFEENMTARSALPAALPATFGDSFCAKEWLRRNPFQMEMILTHIPFQPWTKNGSLERVQSFSVWIKHQPKKTNAKQKSNKIIKFVFVEQREISSAVMIPRNNMQQSCHVKNIAYYNN